MDIKNWAAGIRAERVAGKNFRPPVERQEEEDGQDLRAVVHEVEVVAPVDGNEARVFVDGQEFKGILDTAVEFGLDKPTVVTIKFYANVRSRYETDRT